MMLIEADGKRMLDDFGLQVPPNRKLIAVSEIVSAGKKPVAVKAQLLSGGRGKMGLVELTSPELLAETVEVVRKRMTFAGYSPLVMIEDQIDIASEHYLAWRIDDVHRSLVLMFSMHGGIEVESFPESVQELLFEPLELVRSEPISAFLQQCGLSGRALSAVTRFALELHALMVREDGVLMEINPLVLTKRSVAVALDAKFILDDNASFRHGEWREFASTKLLGSAIDQIERDAQEAGITFVSLPGEVAILNGGAGVGMTLVDLLADAGYSAANFVDLPGGSGHRFTDLAKLVMRRAAAPEVKAMIIFLTMSATSLKEPIERLLAVLDEQQVGKPIIVGLVAGGSAERELSLADAKDLFRNRGMVCVDDLEAAVAAAVRAIEA